ncbi:MAG: DsbA family protein [Patescibacteria group bacterium]
MNKFTISIIVLLVAFGVLIFMASRNGTQSNLSDQDRADILAIQADDHIQGNPDADVVLVEYADLECPACAAFHPLVQEVLAQYGDSIAVVSRHFPLSIHQNSRTAAWAVEAAALQGKYYEMADMLYTRQSEWSGKIANVSIFEPYAEELGLDMAQYRADVLSDEVKARVEKDLQESRTLGLNSTPTFFLQGEKLVGVGNANAFAQAIEGAIAKANALVQEEEETNTSITTSTSSMSTSTATSS